MPSNEEHISRWERKCVFREYCKWDVKTDLLKKKVLSSDINLIIEKLEQSDFINEKRYVQAFFNDHFRIQRWGPFKIAQKLKEKRLPSYLIAEVCSNYDHKILLDNLQYLFERKVNYEAYSMPLTIDQKQKISRYLIQKGYPMHTLYNIISD